MSEHKPLYTHSFSEAMEYGERDQWRDSYRDNCDCARAIERAIASHYHDNRLEDCAQEIIEQYGFDRVNWVLANTLQEKRQDGRFSPDNKNWARDFHIPRDDVRWHFCVESHPGLTDIFVSEVREAWQALGLFNHTHCSAEGDYTGKLLILKPRTLKDDYRTPDFQLFYAQSGFGCRPTSSGRKVYGIFLKDGEKTYFSRSDFIGVIKDEHIPEWAKERLDEIRPASAGQDESDGLTMGGM